MNESLLPFLSFDFLRFLCTLVDDIDLPDTASHHGDRASNSRAEKGPTARGIALHLASVSVYAVECRRMMSKAILTESTIVHRPSNGPVSVCIFYHFYRIHLLARVYCTEALVPGVLVPDVMVEALVLP